MTYEAFYGSGPQFLWNCILQVESFCLVCLIQEGMLVVPSPQMSTWDQVFSTGALTLWNPLPEIRMAPFFFP